MTDVARRRRNVQQEEVKNGAAVSESTWNKIGGAVNFINDRQNAKFQFGIIKLHAISGSPTYNGITTPFTNFGSPEAVPFDCEVVAVCCYHGAPGSSGTSELDLLYQPVNSAAPFVTIFATTPKVTSAAIAERYFDSLGNNTTPTGCTAPVLSIATFAAGDKIRCDILSTMGGTPNGFLIDIFIRPI